MKLRNLSISGVAAATLAVAGVGQDHNGFCGIAHHGSVPLGVSPSYKAEFLPGRVVFTPALGVAAPENAPVAFALESVSRSDGTLLHDVRSEPYPVVDMAKGRVEYMHGGNVVERYDVRVEGVAQSFVFSAPLRGRGDLVVTLRLDTALAALLGTHDRVRFDGPAGGVSFGAITGIDASGRRAPGMFRVAGERLELRLPGEFVEQAAFPLVLDPLIGASAVISGNDDALNPDGAFDSDSATYLAAFQVRFSVLDADVFAARLAEDGSMLGIDTIAASAALELEPTVASIDPTDRFLVAWRQAPTPFGVYEVFGRSVTPAGGTSAAVALTSSTGNHEDPDLAGEVAFGANAVLVWRETGGGIFSTAVGVPANGDPVPGALSTVTPDASARHPVITKSGGAVGQNVVAWVEEGGVGNGQIVGRVVNRGGFPISAEAFIGPAEPEREAARLDVDGDGTEFVLVYERTHSTAPNVRRDVYLQKLSWNGLALAETGAPLALADDQALDESEPQIALVGRKYLAVWLREESASLRLVHAVYDTACAVCGTSGDVGSGGATSRDTAPAIASQSAGGSDGDEAMILFGDFALALPFTGQVRAQRFDAMLGGPMTTVHPGCGNGGTAATNGPFAIGNEDLRFTVSGADPQTALAGLSLALGGATISCGPCNYLPPAALTFTVPVGGAASSPFPLPCDPGFVGLPIEFQWLMIGAPGAPCPTAPGLAASEWQRVVIGH